MHLIALLLALSPFPARAHQPAPSVVTCAQRLYPREIDPAAAFEDLVAWIHDEIIVARGAPGLVVGVSGTDSILAFLAVARAFERAGRPGRAVGLHFGAAGEKDDWFQRDVLPWLEREAPGARLLIDDSIDHARDGLRWGALLDWSVHRDRHWVVGTRNRTETALGTYSNLSRAASVQPLTKLWKSEVLQICRFLGTPRPALDQSARADCACGREDLPALHIPEVDALLMARANEISPNYARQIMDEGLYRTLDDYVATQIRETAFKAEPPAEFAAPPPAAGFARDAAALAELKSMIAENRVVGRVFTDRVPALIAEARANVAADLVTTPATDRAAWLPEALTLFNVPGLRAAPRGRMIESVFGAAVDSTPRAARLGKIAGRLGYLGFGFARWRFWFKSFDQKVSLGERFGWRALDRATDRDLGPGFRREEADRTLELRQSYVMVSTATGAGPATLIVRNDSPVYGRDLLPSAGYVAWQTFDADVLNDLTAEKLAADARFIPIDRLVTARADLDLDDKLRRLDALLDHVDGVELEMNEWLRRSDGGLPHLVALLRRASAVHKIYLAAVPAGEPSWRPANVTFVDDALVRRIETSGDIGFVTRGRPGDARLTLLSGPRGDFP